MKIPAKVMPRFAGLKEKISGDADNADLRKAILEALPEAVEQTKEIAPYFKATNERETAKRIFDFLKKRVKYKADDYRQVIQLPSAILRPGAIADCKSLSLFTAAILQNLGIPWHFVLASYSESTIPGHIYVQTDSGIIIDVVWGKFDSEKKPNYRYKMKHNLNSAAMGSAEPIGNIIKKGAEKVKQATSFVKEKAQDVKEFAKEKAEDVKGSFEQFTTWSKEKVNTVIDKAKTVGLSPGRSLLLIIVKNNLDGMASKFARMDQGQLRAAWNNAGGNWTNLTEAIRKGASKRSRNIGLLKAIAKIAGINGIGQARTSEFFQKPEVQAAIISLSTSIGTAVGAAVGSATGPGAALTAAKGGGAGGSMGLVLNAMAKILPTLLSMMSAQDRGNPEPILVEPEVGPPITEDKEKTKALLIGGGILAAGIIIYLATKKKK